MSKEFNDVFAKWQTRDSGEPPAIARIASKTYPQSPSQLRRNRLRKNQDDRKNTVKEALFRNLDEGKISRKSSQVTPVPTKVEGETSPPKGYKIKSNKLKDRMKAFESSNGSSPSWAKTKSAEATKPHRDKISAKRLELRKKRISGTAPTKAKKIMATRLDALDEFIPPVYEKSNLDAQVIQDALAENFVFDSLNKKDRKTLTKAFEKIHVHSGEVIIKQGDQGDYFYVISKGKVKFEVNGKAVGAAGPGMSFGELALLYTSPRAASVVAVTNPTTLFRVDQKTFRYIMQAKAKESEGEKLKLLKNIKFLKDLSTMDLQRLTNCMVPRQFQKDEVVVTKGEDGDAFYILQSGSMKVCDISVGTSKYEDVTLNPGNYFGERALITSEPRAANVVGLEAGSCFVIDRFTFEKVLGSFSQVIMKSQDKVKLEGLKVIKQANLKSQVLDRLAGAMVDKKFRAMEYIQRKGRDTEAALYLVREGTVSIDGNDINAGGYFGDDQLLADTSGASDASGLITADYTVRSETDSVCAVLTLKECRLLFDTAIAMEAPSKKIDDAYDFKHSIIMKRRSTIKNLFQQQNLMMDDLEKDKLLGEGQFGEVWLVKADVWGTGEEEMKEEFALKIQDLEAEGMKEMVKREMEVMDSLNHPFIVDLVKSHETEVESQMLMTMVEGGELWSVIHREQPDGNWISGIGEENAKFYALVVADTLAYMHHHNVIFRDLKPENILIDADGYPNIIDFGFAKVTEENTYTFCGTPNYVAPEIVLSAGHGAAVDHWALGVMIYEMICGENPFYYDGMDNGTLYEAIAKEDPYPLQGDVSSAAKALIDGLLEKDPAHRLGSLAGRERDILTHEFFKGLNLTELKNKEFKAPWLPPVD